MRNKIIKFLSELPADLSAQFNEALQLFIQTPGHNPSMARYYNSAGYSAQRLSELMYDLKKAYDILPSDIVLEPVKIVVMAGAPKDVKPSGFPEFSKGPKGNLERREYVEKLGLTAKSNKNADLDAVILEYLKTTPVVTASVVASGKSLDELVRELAGMKFRKETPSEAFLKELETVANLSEVEFKKFIDAVESSSEAIDGAFGKLNQVEGSGKIGDVVGFSTEASDQSKNENANPGSNEDTSNEDTSKKK